MSKPSIKRERVEALMKRCQVGTGGPRALEQAHDILADCYGMLGRLLLERDELVRQLAEGQRDFGSEPLEHRWAP